jgi:hypothetical protein
MSRIPSGSPSATKTLIVNASLGMASPVIQPTYGLAIFTP